MGAVALLRAVLPGAAAAEAHTTTAAAAILGPVESVGSSQGPVGQGASDGADRGPATAPRQGLSEITREPERLEFENGELLVRASGRGARLLSVRLKGFSLTVDKRQDRDDPRRALELVYHSKAPVSAFSVYLPAGPYSDPTHPLHPLVGLLETSDWAMEKLAADAEHGEGVRWSLTAGPFEFVKTFRLPRRGYAGEFALEVRAVDTALENSRDASSSLQILVLPGGWVFSDHDQFFPSPYAAAGHSAGDASDVVVQKTASSLDLRANTGVPVSGELLTRPEGERIHFVVDANKYFAAGLLPKNAPAIDGLLGVRILGTKALDARDRLEDRVASVAVLQSRLPKFGEPLRYEFTAFFGPKSDEALESVPKLHAIVKSDRTSFLSFGWLSAAFTAMLKLYAGLTHNWGVAIILLTISLRIAMFPLTRKSQAAMADMAAKQAAIKPQLDEIAKKYKDNSKKLAEERFRIFKENKVPLAPPLMGCLPLFLNIPIFVGFFSAIRPLYDLRQEPFVLWVTDLSRPDELVSFAGSVHIPLVGEVGGLNVLPLIMMAMWIVTQLVMQKNMPRPSDPQQAQVQKFTMVLSTVIGFTLYNYASGLALYAITSSTITVLEQTLIRKIWPPPVYRPLTATVR